MHTHKARGTRTDHEGDIGDAPLQNELLHVIIEEHPVGVWHPRGVE